MIVSILFIALALVILTYGANWLVQGSSSLALRCGLTPLAVGLTVVAFGTSAPELVVSLKAVLSGQDDLAVGNVIGSNIFNIAVILGVTALICPMRVEPQVIKIDAPIMIAFSLLGAFFLLDLQISRMEAVLFLAFLVAYIVFSYWLARKTHNSKLESEFAESMPKEPGSVPFNILAILGGLLLLVIGGRLLVDNAVSLARIMGLSEAIIGLTIVAAGTSMPELATSVVAAWKKEPEIAIGNIVGSNIFNVLCILGVCAAIHPIESPGLRLTDLMVMLAFSLVLLPLLATGFTLKRWEGSLLLGGYGIYLFCMWPK
ncbi:MAG: calcium/sodium antiporter [Blastochloris sp.]|nr:calcium/sodium antiporter [Blastochloris sp.]